MFTFVFFVMGHVTRSTGMAMFAVTWVDTRINAWINTWINAWINTWVDTRVAIRVDIRINIRIDITSTRERCTSVIEGNTYVSIVRTPRRSRECTIASIIQRITIGRWVQRSHSLGNGSADGGGTGQITRTAR